MPPVTNPVIVLDDHHHSDSDSSGTVENDPDKGYFLHEETPEEIDLTTESFDEGDYLTDDCFQRLIRDWRPSEAIQTSSTAQISPTKTRTRTKTDHPRSLRGRHPLQTRPIRRTT